jgi:methylation protein EvaC
MPIANCFQLPEEQPEEYRFDLTVGVCPKCSMVQLVDQPEPERMFHENYAYFSSISRSMAHHFKEFAEMVRTERLNEPNPFVVELGSNDGIMLRHFADWGVRHLGVEPSANVAAAAREKGVNTLCAFFNEATAQSILAEHGPADAILAANVMCHIPTLHSVIEGFTTLLKPSGVIMYEDPYLGDIISRNSYDQIYDEHVFYFSLRSVGELFGMHGFELVDAIPQEVHGGSMRYVLARKGAHKPTARLQELLEAEGRLNLGTLATYDAFRGRVELSRENLVSTLKELKAQGKRVLGYGATSKSTTVLNYCGIGTDLIDFISDTTPTKQGRLTPGSRIPVRPYADFQASLPDVALLFAWNHGKEIIANEHTFQQGGGKWLLYVPEVEILS